MLAKLTGPDGEFRFDGLSPGRTMLSARKPGFFGEQELGSTGAQRASLTEIGPNTQPAILKLYPEGLIFGRVTGDDGQPIENIPISVMSMHVFNGRKQWQNRQFDSTDEGGEYRLAEMAPGNYYLVVGPSRNVPPAGLGAPGHGPEGYAVAFYPAGQDLSCSHANQNRSRETRSSRLLSFPGTVLSRERHGCWHSSGTGRVCLPGK